MSSEIVGSLERAPETDVVERRSSRVLAIELIGPVTILGGVVWAILQPYRIVFLDHTADSGFYDYLVQPPLLVVGVGLLFALVIAPGLLEDLRSTDGTKS